MATKKTDYWKKQLERADREEAKWRKKARKVVERYKDEKDDAHDYTQKRQFNILWSTTETMRPALLSAAPVPEVRPRYKQQDPIARVAAKIAERSIEFSLDTYDFISYGKKLVNDYLLPGRGVTRVRYKPTFEKKKERVPLQMMDEGGEIVFRRKNGQSEDNFDTDAEGAFVMDEIEDLVYEEVHPERVPWKWFRCDPADEWKNCNWVAFGAPFTDSEGRDEFGKAWEGVSIKNHVDTDSQSVKSEAMKDKIIVWEIWDKRTRKQLFVADGHDFILEENKDPLSLEDFFPMPEPIYAVEDNDTMVPTPEFCLWQDQADELDLITERISKVTSAIKARGAYAGEKKRELTEILTADDNELVAMDDWVSMIDKGGLDGLISWVPIEQFAKVLQILENERRTKIQEIFELTGISDIMRGSSDQYETAEAQRIKASSAGRRLLTKQQAVQAHFRDIFRLKVEIIAENFDPQTLKMMVGLDDDAENEIFDEALEMLKNDSRRAFNVDVETDSTIAPDEEREKRGLSEAMQAVSGYMTAIGPLVQSGALPMPVAMGLLQDYLRKFRFGRKLDELLEQMKNAEPPPDQNQEAQKAEMDVKMQEMQAELQMKQEESATKIKEAEAKMQATIEAAQAEMAMQMEQHREEMEQDRQKHAQEMRQAEEKHDAQIRQIEELTAAKAEATRSAAEQRPTN